MPWKLTIGFTFDAAHTIVGYDGPCGRLHGHTYRVKLTLESDRLRSSAHLGREAMVADFRTLKWAKKDVDAGGLDHMNLNDHPEIGRDSTAEVIARYIWQETMRRVRGNLDPNDAGNDLNLRVTLWETPESSCEYWE